MGFTSPELSTSDGSPVETYHFATGVDNFYFTNSENVITIGADDYQPIPIQRSQPSQSQEKSATKLTVTMDYLETVSDEFAQLMITEPTEGKTTLTIQRMHLTDDGVTFVQFWEGAVISSAYNEDGEVEMLCDGIKNIFAREGPRMTNGSSCQHTLFDGLCEISEGDFSVFLVPITALSSDGVTVTVDEANLGSPLPDYVGGKMVKDGGADKRLIVLQAGGVLTLQQPFRSDFGVGDQVTITQGCDHTLTDCKDQFNNVINYGGSPYTPGLNPFIEGMDRL